MTGGQIAGLIAAVAFAVLVLFIIFVLMRMMRTLGEVNKSISSITSDVDGLSNEVENILVKSNILLDDVNGKVATIDPLFQAVADLSESVSDLNDASRGLMTHVSATSKKAKDSSAFINVGKKAFSFYKNRKV
ncbi:DUF948 domain-containing protein [Dellaglioa sp. P0083]|uniref:DUF948 domain-containing protein n=1 Tax=Dellaglioa kimchii TaxID=3344667 RepID=UPI0038D4770D